MLANFITIDPGPGAVVPCTYDNTIICVHMISQVMNEDHGRFLNITFHIYNAICSHKHIQTNFDVIYDCPCKNQPSLHQN